MSTIPHEIWLHIAQFIPVRVLLSLISLNSTFFELAMNYRYRQMSFAYLDNRMIRSLARLRDPAVAKRVRILHIYPGFLKEILDKEKEKPEPEPILRRSFREKLTDLGNSLLEQKLSLKNPRVRLIRTFRQAEDIVQAMLVVLSGLPNVTDYYVTWCGLPSISATAVPFLSTVFHTNLRKLSLELSLDNAKSLLTPAFQVPNLKELQLCIHSENVASKYECSGDIMRLHLAPAISRLRSTLEILSIQAWEPIDFSPMFRALKTLPKLDQVVIAVPAEAVHLGDPTGLGEFLSANRHTVRVLRLRATQYGGHGLTPNPFSFDCWIKAAITGVKLPNLRVLDISTNMFPVGTSLLCLNQFYSTITSLSLTGSYRTFPDVEEIINLVASKSREEYLSTLRIGLISLSPQLVNLIASKLPHLSRLDLVVKYILPDAYDLPLLRSQGDVQETAQIEDFLTEMEDHTFSHWQLRQLSVLAEFLPQRPHYEMLLEQTFLASVPSIVTYT